MVLLHAQIVPMRRMARQHQNLVTLGRFEQRALDAFAARVVGMDHGIVEQ